MLESKQERIKYGEEAESEILSWIRNANLVAMATGDIFGYPEEFENPKDATYARLMNMVLGDIIVFGYGGVDVKRGSYIVTLDSTKKFLGCDYILTNGAMDRNKTYVIPRHAVVNYINKVELEKLEKLEGGSLGYRLTPSRMYSAKKFDDWLKERINGSKTLQN